MSNALIRSFPALAGATLLTCAAWDLLAWKAPLGLGACLASLTTLALVAMRWPRALQGGAGRVLAVAAPASALSLLAEPGPMGMLLASCLTVAIASRGRRRGPAPAWDLAAILSFALVALRAGIAGLHRPRPALRRHVTSSLGPWLVPACVAGVFAIVFAAGDALFLKAATDALRWLARVLRPDPARVMTWCAIAIGAWGLLRFRLPSPVARAVAAMTSCSRAEHAGITVPLAVRTLVLLHAVFLVENALGVLHAWLGRPAPAAMTLAEGAHRAAWALLLAAALSAALTLVAFVRGGAVERSPVARWLAVAWMGQVAILLVTAILYLQRYVVAYSLTRMRLGAIVWMGLVAVGILLLATRLVLRRNNGWLLGAATLGSLVVLMGVAWTDVNGLVARFNVRHCREVGGGAAPLDVAYLASLGEPALPAIAEALSRMRASGEWKTPGATWVALVVADGKLRGRLAVRSADWRGLSARRLAVAR